MKRVDAKVASLERKCPSKVTGRHLFFQDMCEELKVQLGASKLSFEQRSAAMKTHAEAYRALPIVEIMRYEGRAASRGTRVASLQAEALEELRQLRKAALEDVEGLRGAFAGFIAGADVE